MAVFTMYPVGAYRLITDLNIATTTFKVMLLKTSAAYTKTEVVVSTSLTAAELVATNYTGAYGGAGRKTATITAQQSLTLAGAVATLADLTWTALGGATNDTVGACALIYETGGSDATAIPIAYMDLANTPTNGSDFTIDFAALGDTANIQFATDDI